MHLSTRTCYGVRALLELAEYYGKGPLSLALISQHQDLSVKYLEQLMTLLKSAGMVRSLRGAKGGYLLTRAPDQVLMSDVYNSLEGPTTTTDCVQRDDICYRSPSCLIRPVWADVHDAIMNILQVVTLQDLVNKLPAKEDTDS